MMIFDKDMGIANLKFVVARNNDSGWNATPRAPESFLFAVLADFRLNEHLRGGVMGYHSKPDKEVVVNGVESDTDFTAFSVYMGYAFTPSIELKCMYYHQKHGDTWAMQNSGALPGTPQFDDKADAWKVILDVKQEALKYSSLWLEYAKIDNNFMVVGKPYAEYGVDLLHNKRFVHNTATATLAGAKAEQRWNDKWNTVLRYYQIDLDTPGLEKAKEWSVGVGYQYSPAIKFELSYNKIDYGTNTAQIDGLRNGDDNVVRFRTFVAF